MASDQVPSRRCYAIKSKMLDGVEISSCALSCWQCKIETVHWFCNVEEHLDRHWFAANYRCALNSLAPCLSHLFSSHSKPALAQISDWSFWGIAEGGGESKELPSSHQPFPCNGFSPEIQSVPEDLVPNDIPCYAVLDFTEVLYSVLGDLKEIMLYRNSKDHI